MIARRVRRKSAAAALTVWGRYAKNTGMLILLAGADGALGSPVAGQPRGA
jgi:hypothetical protein